MENHELRRLQATYSKVATSLVDDPIYLPIVLHLEAEIAVAQIEGDSSCGMSRAGFESRTIAHLHAGDLRL